MLIVLDLLPAWVPSDELLIAVLALIALVLVMNKGNMWVLNVLAQDEPLLSAMGVAVFLLGWSGWLTANSGVANNTTWMAIGAVVALAGVFVLRSDRLDIRRLI